MSATLPRVVRRAIDLGCFLALGSSLSACRPSTEPSWCDLDMPPELICDGLSRGRLFCDSCGMVWSCDGSWWLETTYDCDCVTGAGGMDTRSPFCAY